MFNFLDRNHGINRGSVGDLEWCGDTLLVASGLGYYMYNHVTGQWVEEPIFGRNFHSFYGQIESGDNGLVVVHESYDSLYISEDYGQSWRSLSMPRIFSAFSGYNFEVIGSTIWLFRTELGTVFSNDFGFTWERAQNGNYIGQVVEFSSELIAHNNNEILRSSDDGVSWETIAGADELGRGAILNISIANDKLFVVLAEYGDEKITLFRSDDGVQWTPFFDGLPSSRFPIVNEDVEKFSVYYSDNKYYFSLPSTGLFVSNDARTWEPVAPVRFNRLIEKDGVFYLGHIYEGLIIIYPSEVNGRVTTGNVYCDKNGNGVNDNEPALMRVPISYNSSEHFINYSCAYTDSNGNFDLTLYDLRADTIRPLLSSSYVSKVSPSYYLSTDTADSFDFGIEFEKDITDMSVRGYFDVPRPGFNCQINVQIENIGTLGSSGMLSVRLPSEVSYLSAEPAPSVIAGDSLVWDYFALSPFEQFQFKVNVNVDRSAPLGANLRTSFRVIPELRDVDLNNNVHIDNAEVRGSYDPNDKLVNPATGLTPSQIANGDEVYYTVRFQNTGTFYAENVRIVDQLDTALYLPSLRLVQSSHEVSSFDLKPNGLLDIRFDGIMLPDSSMDLLESNGFVTFAIRRNIQFNAEDVIYNTASIYFDFNDPIVTNTVEFSIPVPVSIEDNRVVENEWFVLFPNPTTGAISIDLMDSDVNEIELSIYTASGHCVYFKELDRIRNQITIDQELDNGVYVVSVLTNKGLWIEKLVVHK